MNRMSKRRALAWPTGALLALALAAAPLHADTARPTQDSWVKLFGYGACALGIAAATTGLGIAAAVAVCLQVFAIDAG